jgi:hypothetical protein
MITIQLLYVLHSTLQKGNLSLPCVLAVFYMKRYHLKEHEKGSYYLKHKIYGDWTVFLKKKNTQYSVA